MELLVFAGQHEERAPRNGDVITIQPDGWQWTERERANPDWRIIRAPILPTLMDTLLAPGNGCYRAWRLDLSRLPRDECDGNEVADAAVQK